jgi:hypothetical protein
MIAEMRRQHPRWDAKRIRLEMLRRPPEGMALPPERTINRIFVRQGLVLPRPRKRPGGSYRRRLASDREYCSRGPSHSVHGSESVITATCRNRPLTCHSAEPPIEIEPMTYALRGTWSLPAHALAAAIAQAISLTALAALGLSGAPFHEPFREPFGAR